MIKIFIENYYYHAYDYFELKIELKIIVCKINYKNKLSFFNSD